MDPYKTHGAFSWSELTTPDPAAAAEFYGKLLGWTFEIRHLPHGEYRVVKVAGTPVGGLVEAPRESAQPRSPLPPPLWGCYVTVSDVDGSANKAKQLGATVVVPPTDLPGVGRFTVIRDPQGALLHLVAYASSAR